MRQRAGRAICLVWLAIIALAQAEQQGEYFRENQDIPLTERRPDQVADLLFWLRSDTGVTTDDQGAVTQWADASGNGVDFAALTEAKQPVRVVERALGANPAVAFVSSRHEPCGLLSKTVGIEPGKGMTLLVVARIAEPVFLGNLLGYGATYRTAGAIALVARGYRHYDRALAQAHVGQGKPPLEAQAGNLCGKGFVLLATRFDPATGEQALFQDGVEIERTRRDEPLAAENPFAVGVEARRTWSFEGAMVTALAYNRALNDEELGAVGGWLRRFYGLEANEVSALAPKLPFAYYPSRNQMEVAIALGPQVLAKAGTHPETVTVRVLPTASDKVVATGTVPLDGQGRGQTVFDVPELPEGEYAVEYLIGTHVERSPQTFTRRRFPFEGTAYGETHEVFPPFTPVEVRGNDVLVVDRRYTINELGLFDSVVSLDRELLAAPMRLVGETTDGELPTWRTGWFTDGVKGKELHPDEAVFETKAKSAVLNVESRVTIQEDGCAKVEMTLAPRSATVIRHLAIEIPLKDAEVPLFHYVADNGMRFNYAGYTPRGGGIEWYREPWDGWVPQRWRVAEPGPDDGVIWNSSQTHQHNNRHKWDHRPFVPYLWLGAEQRGLAFFMESEAGFETDLRTPLQKVERRGDRVIVRVEIIQQPVTLTAPRTIVFGLMASPGKPREPAFRTRGFASGIGPVSCWGGWQCASKYPTEHDWSIVDKIQEIRRRGDFTKDDQAWFEAKYAEVRARWPERKINGSTDWLWLTTHFAKRAADRGASHSGVYFEEHATDPRLPEWEVFQDEWASAEFPRFRERRANWGVFSPSYHDFTLYMANEWMSRGVSLYFDNTNPKRCYNERFGPAYRTATGALVYGISIFQQREYYRRIYKLRSQWNRRGAPYPIDFTLHITNTQTLPFNTWATATLDLEQRAYTENPEEVPSEVDHEPGARKDGKQPSKQKRRAMKGYQLPWPPDYTRTITMGGQVGVIPLALDYVSGHGRHHANEYTPEMMLRMWAMSRVHDVRPSGLWPKTAVLAREYDAALLDFGYGKPEVTHHNYWADSPFVDVGDHRVKWLALVRGDQGLLLLQSYSRKEEIAVPVVFPGATRFQEIHTAETLVADHGAVHLTLPANFSTCMYLVTLDR